MKEVNLVINNATGLHARPARTLVDVAKRFQSTIRVRYGEKLANGKSLISVLTLGIRSGQSIAILVDGVDEATAADALASAVRSGLGEDLTAVHEGPPSSAARRARAAPARATHAQRDGAREASAIHQMSVVRGLPAAQGIAVGPVHQLRHVEIAVREVTTGPAHEQARLQTALDAARQQLAALGNQMLVRRGGWEASMFQVHEEILRDPDLLTQVQVNIESGQSAAEAWQAAIAQSASELAELPDELLAERAIDVRDVGERVLRLLVGLNSPTASLPNEPFVLIAHDLRPSDAAVLDPRRVLGFCTAAGGPHAHTAILARALGLPAVVGAGPLVLDIPDRTSVILDGGAGTITIGPDTVEVDRARTAQRQAAVRNEASVQANLNPVSTADGHRVDVVANVGSLSEAQDAAAAGAEGVGLLRTEFLFLARTRPPTEDEQFAVYRDIVQAMNGRPVIVRTLDVGGDKVPPYLTLPVEENPVLGERGIRLCLANLDLLRTQLRAILRAAAFGPLRVMFPMVSDLGELRRVRAVVDTLRTELGAPPVEIGIMIEIPSAALMVDAFSAEVDFFSIGTNDLTQYTLAMDRAHPTLSLHLDGLHPAVLRLIDGAVRAARKAGKRVALCGELSSDPMAVPILLGLGIQELSVSVSAIPAVRTQIRSLDLAKCRELAARALACGTAQEVRERVSMQ
jgi:phosphocarrier protein FPr